MAAASPPMAVRSDTVATASAYNNVYNNQIVGTVNMGIEFGAGHDNVAYNNTVISSGLLPNGTRFPAQNVGLTIYDVYGNIKRQYVQQRHVRQYRGLDVLGSTMCLGWIPER
jgi:parallel beta-helix repeat protein